MLPRTELKRFTRAQVPERLFFFLLLLVLTDKMAFTCRHVFILDRDSRGGQRAYTPSVVVATRTSRWIFRRRVSAFSIIQVKMSTLLCPGCAHFAFYSDSSARRVILHSAVERLIKPHFSLRVSTHYSLSTLLSSLLRSLVINYSRSYY